MTRRKSNLHRLNTAALDMAPRARRFLYIWSYLSGLLAIQILHLALDDLVLNLWLSLALSAGFVYAYNLAPRWRPLTTYGVSAVAVGLSVFFYLKLQQNIWMAGSTLGVLLGLLMVLLSFKAFAPGDHRFIILVCVIFIIYSAHQSYDLKLMLALPIFLFCAGCSLYAASQIEVATRVSQTVGSDVGEAVSEKRIEVGRSFLLMLLRAVVGLIVLSAIAFVVTPHSEEGQRNLLMNTSPQVEPMDANQGPRGNSKNGQAPKSQKDAEAEVGLGSNFDLGEGSKLTADPRPVLQMKSHRATYLRAQVYDVYTGSGWTKSPWMDDPNRATMEALGKDPGLTGKIQASLESVSTLIQGNNESESAFKVPLQDFPSVEGEQRLTNKGITVAVNNVKSGAQGNELQFDEIHQEIKLLEDQPPFYFAAYAPYQIENVSLSRGGSLLDTPLADHAGTIRPVDLSRWHPAKFSYTVRSLEIRYKPRDLDAVISRGPKEIVNRYTQLPLEKRADPGELAQYGVSTNQYRPISEKVINLARTVANRRSFGSAEVTIYDQVENIYNFLTDPNEFEYTRNYVPVNDREEFTEQFLFNSQKGHCRYFASTMAVMCRINGIPARVVSGYAPGSFSIVDNAYIYRASNAHAWVEVYFDGYGWVTYDPSPAAGGGGGPPKGPAQFLARIIDFLTNLFVLDPAATQRLIISALRQAWHFILTNGPATLTLLATIILAVFAWLRLRDRLGRSRGVRLTPENGVVDCYLQALRVLKRLGLSGSESGLTARRRFALAGRAWEPLTEPLAALLPLYERAAFAVSSPELQDIQAAQAAVTQLDQLVEQRLAELKRRRRGGR